MKWILFALPEKVFDIVGTGVSQEKKLSSFYLLIFLLVFFFLKSSKSSIQVYIQVYNHTPNMNAKVGMNCQIVQFAHIFLRGRKKGLLWVKVLDWNKGCQR